MKNITKLLTFAGLAVGFATCASADITWTFNNVNFCLHCGDPTETDNNVRAGSFFTTNDAATAITGWTIFVDGTNAGAVDEYQFGVGDNGVLFPDAFHVDFYNTGFTMFLDLYLGSPGITNVGGTVSLLQGNNPPIDNNSTTACRGCSILSSEGSVTGSTVPEPRFGALAVIGLAGLGFLARRKFAPARS